MLLILLFIAAIVLFAVGSARESSNRGVKVQEGTQVALNGIIDQVLTLHGMNYSSSVNDTDNDYSMRNKGSAIYRVCDDIMSRQNDIRNRVGCRIPDDTRHIYNAMISPTELTLFKGSNTAIPGREENALIPNIDSVIRTIGYRGKTKASIVELKKEETFLSNPHCQQYFHGTLHVIGLQGPTNVYHTISDNYIPMISQIFMDAYTQSPYLKKPRMVVIHKVSVIAGGLKNRESGSHFYLQSKLYSGGIRTWGEIAGTCFERIVWGRGPHAIFHLHLAKQRRIASDFARIHASVLFDLQVPAIWREESSTRTEPQSGAGGVKGMKVVLYTRGESGHGRSLANEAVIIQTLQEAGVRAVKCCDYSAANSLTTQLSLAYHADAVLGMHGAALAHAIFSPKGVYVFELKTLYAFDAVLFALIADAREGTHLQVDIRSYFLNKVGHKAADTKLASRCVQTLEKAVGLTAINRPSTNDDGARSHFAGKTYTSHSNADSRPNLGIAVTGATNMTAELSHFLGPHVQNCPSECEHMVVYKLSKWSGSSKALRDSQCVVDEKFIPSAIKMVHAEDVVNRR